MQIKDKSNIWSTTVSSRLLRRFMKDTTSHKVTLYQFNFIQILIQSEANQRIFVFLNKEYEQFIPNKKEKFGRPSRFSRCICGGDLSGKSWKKIPIAKKLSSNQEK